MRKRLIPCMLVAWWAPVPALTGQELVTVNVDRPPSLDGRADDEAWRLSSAVAFGDGVENVPISLWSVCTKDRIYFLDLLYRKLTLDGFVADKVSRYVLQRPEGSWADVRPKGNRCDGRGTIEFSRRFDTGNSDDVQFWPDETLRLGVTRFEIGGRKPDPSIEQPNYGAGDIAERLALKIQ